MKVTYRVLVCDAMGCPSTYQQPRSAHHRVTHRSRAALVGWKFEGGRDYCPVHAKVEWR